MEQLTEFNTGGSHEQNILGGVPQGINPNGQPNLVEEGETKLNSADYVFSDRLPISLAIAKDYGLDSKFVGKTFSDASKKINDGNSKRIGDSIEEKAKERKLNDLMAAQEAFKQQDLEQSIAAIKERHPELGEQMMQPQQSIQGNPNQQIQPESEASMMSKGGEIYYDFGGGLNKLGTVMKTAAPWLSKIPGAGTIAGAAAGTIGAGLENVGTGADFKEVLKDSTLGGINGVAGMIPGGQLAAGLLTNTVNNNSNDASDQYAMNQITRGNIFPDGGKLNGPVKGKGITSSTVGNKNINFAKPEFKEAIDWEKEEWIKDQTKIDAFTKEKGLPSVTGMKLWIDPSGSGGYTFLEDADLKKTRTIPSNTNSQINKTYVKPVKDPNKPITADRPQTYYTQDATTGEWSDHMVRSVPYQQKNDKGAWESLNTAPIVWVDSQGIEHTTDPRQTQAQAQTFAEGGALPNLEGLDPSVIAYIQQLQQSQNLSQAGQLPDYNETQNLQVPNQQVTQEEIVTPNNIATVENNPNNIEEIGAQMLEADDPEIEAQYRSQLESANLGLTNANQDLRVQQTPLEAGAEALPVAYNIGMGLFGKTGNLNIDDYIMNNQIEAPKMNINPQVRQAEQSYATSADSIKNASPSGGAYMTNLQQLANSRNQTMGQIYTNKENIDAQNQMQADQFNASMEANNNQTRFQVEDYNARAKGAKQQMLSTGLTQAADIGRSATANKLATSYYSLGAPDFKSQVGYKSYFDYLKEKKQNSNNQITE